MQPTARRKRRARSLEAGSERKYSDAYRNLHDCERVALELLGREDVERREGEVHGCKVEENNHNKQEIMVCIRNRSTSKDMSNVYGRLN